MSLLHIFRSLFGADKNQKEIPRQSFQEQNAPLLTADSAVASTAMDVDIFNDPAGTARICRPLTAALGDQFQLSHLYQIFNKENLAHPHLTIRAFRDAGFLVRVEDDRFSWNTTVVQSEVLS